MKRLLITGAAGALGKVARAGVGHLAETIRLTDIAEMAPATGNEEVVQADLSNFDATRDVIDGCDGIVHLGGQPTEGPWENVLNANIIGFYNVYEAARQTGVKRIIFASSNHAIGFHPREVTLDATARPRPDTLYGVSKVYGEALASLYHDKFGIETAILRIGSCFPEPVDHRMLATWLSYSDFVRFIESAFTSPRIGCPVVYGASANREQLWDNQLTSYIGWHPQDTSEPHRARLDTEKGKPGPNDPSLLHHGGMFTSFAHPDD